MSKKTYAIDLKIYEPANMYEVPIQVPEKLLSEHGNLKLGYQQLVICFTEQEFEDFCEWCSKNGSILKIIGSEKLD